MTALTAVLVGLLGLAIGSFLNVVIWRVPRGESVVSPPSHCPRCETAIRGRDNVPVLSWLVLRGRCRHCSEPISARYPLVEAVTAVLFVVLALARGPHADLPAFLYLAAVGVALAMIDLDTHRLPNALTYPSYPVAVALLGGAAALDGDGHALLRALCGMLALLAFYALLVVVYPAGMGLGDLKLSGVLGLYLGWVGWGAWAVGLFSGFLLGGTLSIGLLALGRAGRKSKIPFGPFMLVGALVGVLAGEAVFGAYLDATLG